MAGESRSSTENTTYPDDTYNQQSTITPHSLSQAVHARRAEYTRPRSIKIKIGSWNVAACPDVEKDIGGWFVEGKGIDKRLAGLDISRGITKDLSQDGIETVAGQEARISKKQSTLPLGDKGTIAGGEEIGLYVLGLQEVVPLASAKEYIGRVYSDPGPVTKWKKALKDSLPDGYELVSEQQLSGLLLLIYAAPQVAPLISSVSSVSVGTGIMGYLGNKGAVTTRIILGETTRLVFVNSHLASGTDTTHLDRRCWDVTQVLARTKFDPISWAGVLDDAQEGIGDEDFAFWFGDLNFRLNGLPGEDIRRLLMLHTRGEYGAEARSTKIIGEELDDNEEPIQYVIGSDDESTGPSTPRSYSNHTIDTPSTTLPDPDDFVQDPHLDPTSLQATLDSLLPHDQLRQIQKAKKAFHDGWREGPITFLPTYKYDVGSMGVFDSSEKKRSPGWCDRILFRTRRDKLEFDYKTREEEVARLLDEELMARGIDHAADDDEVLFNYDPESDGTEENQLSDYDENVAESRNNESQDSEVVTKEGYLDRIALDVYTSHQRVLSSDHKPLNAIFTLDYDAVVPELKSKIHQEVARELDRAENEGRPTITVVVDHSQDATRGAAQNSPKDVIEGADFGDVRYLQRVTRGLTIANTGQVPANFLFVSRPSSSDEPDRVAPQWLSVFLDQEERSSKDLEQQLTLEPGDTLNASLSVYVDNISDVRLLNAGNMKLDDVLILRVTDGRDHFITMKGHWLQSCFGRSVAELIRVPEGGVRALLPARGTGPNGPVTNRGQDVRWSAPRELFKLIEAVERLTERAIAERDMIDGVQAPESNGWPFENWTPMDEGSHDLERQLVMEALDSDKGLIDSFSPEISAIKRLEIMSEVLLHFLGSLSDGVIPIELWDKLEIDMSLRKESLGRDDTRSWVLDELSSAPNHSISLVFLTSMLGKMIAELTPVSRSTAASVESTANLARRSLSFKGRSALVLDPAILRRRAVEHRFAEIFAPIIARGPSWLRDKDRRTSEDRKRDIIEIFFQGYGMEV